MTLDSARGPEPLEFIPVTREVFALAAGRRSPPEIDRVRRAQKAFTTRRVDFSDVAGLARGDRPRAGDLVLARVESVGQHPRLELHSGRRAKLYEGDEIVVAFGARYAPDQFYAAVPERLGPCDLVAGGGVAGQVLDRHARVKAPTRLEPIGLLVDADERVLNLERYAIPMADQARRASVVVVAGTSMNAGKTTSAASLIQGLVRSGLRVGAAKLTGTGSGGDVWSMVDAGAELVLDFTDAGHATTANVAGHALHAIADRLLGQLNAAGVDIAVVEIADGLLQAETATLLSSPAFLGTVDAVVFAAGESMGAVAGVEWLRRRHAPVVAVSGLVSTSPLAKAEVETATGLPVRTIHELSDPMVAPMLCLTVDLRAARAAT